MSEKVALKIFTSNLFFRLEEATYCGVTPSILRKHESCPSLTKICSSNRVKFFNPWIKVLNGSAVLQLGRPHQVRDLLSYF